MFTLAGRIPANLRHRLSTDARQTAGILRQHAMVCGCDAGVSTYPNLNEVRLRGNAFSGTLWPTLTSSAFHVDLGENQLTGRVGHHVRWRRS